MRILLLGASGRVGSEFLKLANIDNQEVTAFVRDRTTLIYQAKTVHEGNVLRKEDIHSAMANQDIVVSALGTDGKATLSGSIPFIIESMKYYGIKRIITVGTAGILQSRVSPSLYRYQSTETRRRSPRATQAAEDHRLAYETLKSSTLDWTVICPTYLPDGEAIGNYRYEVDYLPIDGEKISVGDTAQFTFEQITSNKHIHCRVGLAY
ncbi:hypothetical protein DS745_13360 [Anaerobacillus alkaliphilus]|uniref:NAD(P)-binding domain-containing protein n=1 Tax=Anaerobacillus alkaliphilus TaxID=1548597 RepID=A0A4Q0VR75_9BACI|nr:NAD(P)H-binding protein [Anaerobacillus alkaliphilus]RXI99863.1 hypothetical protein DS745_13360 [Anaerobacillus alkaliphilus]